MIPPELLKKILDAIASGDEKAQAALLPEIVASIAGGAAPPADESAALDDTAAPPPADPAKKPAEELSALRKQVEALTQGQAAEIVALRATVTQLTGERDSKEQTERLALCADLVKFSGGVETPATVFDGEPEKLKLRKRLLDEPIAELRARVETLRKRAPGGFVPPAGEDDTSTEIAKLSKETLAAIKAKGWTPEQFISERRGVLKASK